jgi:hypothetical protein
MEWGKVEINPETEDE